MSALSDSIEAQVQANDNLIDSAILLLKQLSQALQAAVDNGDMAAVQATIDELNAKDKVFADAIVANTPAAPTPSVTAPVSADGTANADGTKGAGDKSGVGTVGSQKTGDSPVDPASNEVPNGIGPVTTDATGSTNTPT